MLGWRFQGSIPGQMQKAVVIAAPHTSNWDLPYSLMAAFGLGLQLHWLGKASLFGFPFKGLMALALTEADPGNWCRRLLTVSKTPRGLCFL
jgi:1-acyl-sn-glycerol-3-phosphate acyltransferase